MEVSATAAPIVNFAQIASKTLESQCVFDRRADKTNTFASIARERATAVSQAMICGRSTTTSLSKAPTPV
jgi:hypothetical protein